MHFLDFLKSKSDNGVFILLTYLKGDEFLMKNQIIYQHGPSVSMADLKAGQFSFVKNFPLKNQIMVSLFYLPIKKGKIFDEKSNYIPVRTFSINGRLNRLSLDFYCEKIF